MTPSDGQRMCGTVGPGRVAFKLIMRRPIAYVDPRARCKMMSTAYAYVQPQWQQLYIGILFANLGVKPSEAFEAHEVAPSLIEAKPLLSGFATPAQ